MNTTLRRAAGFTLLELLVVVTIIAILSAIAIPSYRQYVLRGHRTDATRALQDLAAREENFYFANNAYSKLTTDLGSSASVAGRYFSINIPSASSTDYTLRATAIDPQTQDTMCRVFTLDRAGNSLSTDAGGADTSTTCWGK
ncbi:MAG TPA: type IV pilin protein [Rhodanobacter sp.]